MRYLNQECSKTIFCNCSHFGGRTSTGESPGGGRYCWDMSKPVEMQWRWRSTLAWRSCETHRSRTPPRGRSTRPPPPSTLSLPSLYQWSRWRAGQPPRLAPRGALLSPASGLARELERAVPRRASRSRPPP
ncbi:hypothetical protein ZEAMMB73_Zm00001d006861 [Zea mays]|uniref:Uncharacterized protein n=1 Tax=Zea mays TaxID=4577 RepID=A0A1D6F1D9_MAIZE|nr:hypothetical protein ZEAMMB73_Zm00001d006861 [Zea mays]